MPTISIFYGIIIQMYWRDHNPPHLHALYQGHEGLYAIADGQIIAGHLPRTADRIVREWILRRKTELMDNWERGRTNEPMYAIPGADADED